MSSTPDAGAGDDVKAMRPSKSRVSRASRAAVAVASSRASDAGNASKESSALSNPQPTDISDSQGSTPAGTTGTGVTASQETNATQETTAAAPSDAADNGGEDVTPHADTVDAGVEGVGVDVTPGKSRKSHAKKDGKKRKTKRDKEASMPAATRVDATPGSPSRDGGDVRDTEPEHANRGSSVDTNTAPLKMSDFGRQPEPKKKISSDAHGSMSGVFMVTFTGQLTTADFPFNDSLSCKYSFQYGKDWQPVSGMEEGLTQVTRRSQDGRNVVVWNFPIEVTFKSTNPFGWPQIVLTVTGLDSFGREVVRGYGAKHLPVVPGSHEMQVRTFVPKTSNVIQELIGYVVGARAEYIDDKFVAGGAGREVTRVQSQGTVGVSVSVVMKDFRRYGFRCQPERAGDAL